MNFVTLQTQRLILRKFTQETLDQLFQNCSENEIKDYLGLETHEDFLKEKKKCEGGYTTYDRTIAHFKLVLKETNQVIGGGGFHNWYFDHKRAELGYALNKDEYKQKGYMSEAVAAFLEYGFNVMNLNRIEAYIGPQNIASLSLVKKYGFTQEGHLRKHYIRDGIPEDSIIFSLLREEFTPISA